MDSGAERSRHLGRDIGAAVGDDNYSQLARGRGGNKLPEQAPDPLALVMRGNHDGRHTGKGWTTTAACVREFWHTGRVIQKATRIALLPFRVLGRYKY